MKKLIPLLILMFLSTLTVSAQSRGKKKKKGKQRTTETTRDNSSSDESSRSKSTKGNSSDNPREDRSIAITLESGIKTLSGWGLNGSYYVNPNTAIDLGIGIGSQVVKGGIRGRYLFLDKKFTPYVGAGVYFNPLSIDDISVSDTNGDFYFLDVDSSVFGQFIGGAEYMGEKGFTVGFNLGYAVSLTGENWTSTQTLSDEALLVTNFLYGNGVVLGFNIGWAF